MTSREVKITAVGWSLTKIGCSAVPSRKRPLVSSIRSPIVSGFPWHVRSFLASVVESAVALASTLVPTSLGLLQSAGTSGTSALAGISALVGISGIAAFTGTSESTVRSASVLSTSVMLGLAVRLGASITRS